MIYYHIGLHKTGTSSIQRFCKTNRKVLEQRGLIYPAYNQKNHSNIAFEIADSERFNPDGDTIYSVKEAIKNEDGSKKVLISTETFCSFDEKSIFKLLDSMGRQAKCIIYIRPQDEYFESAYAQRAKSGREFRDFDGFASAANLSSMGDYLSTIEKWSAALGADNIIVRSFHKTSLVDGDIIRDFSSIFDIDTSDLDTVWENSALGAHCLSYCAAIFARSRAHFSELSANQREKRYGRTIRRAALSAFPDDVPFRGFTTEQRQRIREQFASHNGELTRRFGVATDWPIKSAAPTAVKAAELPASALLDAAWLLVAESERPEKPKAKRKK